MFSTDGITYKVHYKATILVNGEMDYRSFGSYTFTPPSIHVGSFEALKYANILKEQHPDIVNVIYDIVEVSE